MGNRVVGRYSKITIDGTDRADDLTERKFIYGDRQTFSDFEGGKPTAFDFTAVQDHSVDSMWDLSVNQPGTTVPYVYKPYGNAVATADAPHFSGNMVTSGPSDTFAGGAAGDSQTEGWEFSATWRVLTWEKVTA